MNQQNTSYKPTIKDIVVYPYLGYSTINSTGNKIAFIESAMDLKNNRWKPECYIHDLEKKETRKLTKNACISNLRWTDTNTLAMIRIDTLNNDKQIYVYENLFGDPLKITNHSGTINSFESYRNGFVFLSTKLSKKNHIGNFTHVEAEKGTTGLYFVDLELAKQNSEKEINFFEKEERILEESQFEITSLFQEDFFIQSFVVSPTHDAIYLNCAERADLQCENKKFYFKIEVDTERAMEKINNSRKNGEKIDDFSFIGKVTKLALPSDATIVAVSPSGKKILIKHKERDFRDETQSDLWTLDITEDNSVLENENKVLEQLFNLTKKFDQEPLNVRWSEAAIFFTFWNESKCELAKLDETGELEIINIHNLSIKYFFDANNKGDLCVNAYSDDSFEEIYFIHTQDNEQFIESTTTNNEKYAHWDCGKVESIRWKSKDGVEIEGILRKPSNFDPTKKYPLLIFVHGGPAATSPLALIYGPDRNFHPTINLCNKGIIILSPNYRGSLGRGQWFKELNFDNLGVGDLWDIESGIDFLASEGFIDETKIGCMGASQGGYISAFAGMHSNRFTAVSVGSCAASWYTYYITSDNRDSILLAGESFSKEREESIKRTAPISGIANAKTPMLIQHGANDQRTGVANANELFRALKQKGIHTEFFMFNDAGHGYNYPRNFYATMLQNYRWFCHYLLDEKLDFDKDDF